jgi:hypothetical protein
VVIRFQTLRLIALFKFGKATLLVLVAAGAAGLIRPAIAGWAEQAVAMLAASGNYRLLPAILNRLLGLPSDRLAELAAGALLYASLFLVEGVGLWRGGISDRHRDGIVGTTGAIRAQPWAFSRSGARPGAEPCDRGVLDWPIAPES